MEPDALHAAATLGTLACMRIYAQARALRRTMTPAETALWERLRARRLAGLKFRRQVPLGRFIVDFLTFQHRLIVEVDGAHHDIQADHDTMRTEWLAAQGFRVLRLTNEEVLGDIEHALRRILRASRDARDAGMALLLQAEEAGGMDAGEGPAPGESRRG